jgi:hypothetical protein
LDQVIQVVGALLILAGFVLAQFRVLRVESMLYLVLNFFGSAILAWLAWGASCCWNPSGQSCLRGGSSRC